MLKPDVIARAQRQIKHLTDAYRASKDHGYNVQTMSLPTFETQGDHDQYHPDEKGEDFRDFNEFVKLILEGLHVNKVPAELSLIYYADYVKWLNGKKNTSEHRSAYGAYLCAEKHRDDKKSGH